MVAELYLRVLTYAYIYVKSFFFFVFVVAHSAQAALIVLVFLLFLASFQKFRAWVGATMASVPPTLTLRGSLLLGDAAFYVRPL